MENSLKEWDKSLEKRQMMDRNNLIKKTSPNENVLNNLETTKKDKTQSVDL